MAGVRASESPSWLPCFFMHLLQQQHPRSSLPAAHVVLCDSTWRGVLRYTPSFPPQPWTYLLLPASHSTYYLFPENVFSAPIFHCNVTLDPSSVNPNLLSQKSSLPLTLASPAHTIHLLVSLISPTTQEKSRVLMFTALTWTTYSSYSLQYISSELSTTCDCMHELHL